MKRIQIFDTDTGEIEFQEQVKGYHLVYPKPNDTRLEIRKHLNMGMISGNKVLKTHYYAPIVERIIDKYESLFKHLKNKQHMIMYVEDTVSKGNAKQPNPVEIKKMNSFAADFLNYTYVMEFKFHLLEEMSREQLLVHIYRELLRIHSDGSILKPTEKLTGHIPHTLGRDWDTTKAEIPNILDANFQWRFPPKLVDQLSIYDIAKEEDLEEDLDE